NRLGRETAELNKQLKEFLGNLSQGPKALLEFARASSTAGAAVVGLGLGLEKVVSALSELSQETVELGQNAQLAGMKMAQYREVLEAYERINVGRQAADRAMQNFAKSFSELRLSMGSQMQNRLAELFNQAPKLKQITQDFFKEIETYGPDQMIKG